MNIAWRKRCALCDLSTSAAAIKAVEAFKLWHAGRGGAVGICPDCIHRVKDVVLALLTDENGNCTACGKRHAE